MIPLFNRYPLLKNEIPYTPLGELPTPVEELNRLGGELGIGKLYIKRDDVTGKVYGGNKVRKLEFLLGKALRFKVNEVMTFGAAGSNHALATAIYAQQLGIRSISMLRLQPNANYVRRNILMSYRCKAELHHYPSRDAGKWGAVYQLMIHKLKFGRLPQVIPLGGSSPLGVAGFVNAGLELKDQIMKGEIDEPDFIYVAMGTMGTAVGLALGLKAANLKTRVIPVRVVPEKIANEKKFVNLFHRTNRLLHSTDPSFPTFDFSEGDVEIRKDFYGGQYALFTEEGIEAVACVAKEGFKLEGCYTGKAFASLLNDAAKGSLKDKVVLFWNTHNSRSFSDVIETVDYHELPRAFHRYFEEDVQSLDRHSGG